MIERDLELTLRDLAEAYVRQDASADMREDARLVPLTTSQHRSWLPESPKWRFQTMFGATKLLVAGAVVALFGGFLLAAVLTQPSDEQVPAAVTGSSDPTTDLLPGVDLDTEWVAPGAYRVVSDGTDNDIDFGASSPSSTRVIVGPDGSVWVFDRSRLRQLGADRTIRLNSNGPDISVAPDGTIWALGRPERKDRPLYSFVGGERTAHPPPRGATFTGVETAPDGSVWATWYAGDSLTGQLSVGRLVDGEWQEEDLEPPLAAGDSGGLTIGPEGTMLLGSAYLHTRPPAAEWVGALERLKDGWAPVDSIAPRQARTGGVGRIAIGREGTVWAYDVVWQPGESPQGTRLHRRTKDGWETFGADGSVPWLVGTQMWESSVTVGSDGRLWIAFDWPVGTQAWPDQEGDGQAESGPRDEGCAGLLSFDGVAWRQHLTGACANHVSAAQNGDVWVTVTERDHQAYRSLDPERAPPGLYVITPEAVVATK